MLDIRFFGDGKNSLPAAKARQLRCCPAIEDATREQLIRQGRPEQAAVSSGPGNILLLDENKVHVRCTEVAD